MRVHILARHPRLSIPNSLLPPYPVDGNLETHGLGDSAVMLNFVLYAVAEPALHLAVLLGYGCAVLAFGELQGVAFGGIAHHRSPPPRLPQELLGGDDAGVRGVGYGVVGHGYCSDSTTSQWPPLSGPTRRIRPVSRNLRIFSCVFLKEMPNISDNSEAVTNGFSLISRIMAC